METLLATLAALSLLLTASTTTKAEVDASASGRVITVTGIIDGNTATAFRENMDALSRESTDDIFILINSPGGYVIEGMTMLSAVEAARHRGVNVICMVAIKAASMAMHLLNSCTERYALKNAMLLFHEARLQMGGSLSPSEIRTVKEQMDLLMRHLEESLISNLGTTREIFDKHNIAQTYWPAATFDEVFPAFLTVVQDFKLPDNVPLFAE